MVDLCEIYRDEEFNDDDDWDPDAATLTRPDEDELLIYDGKCLVSTKGWQPMLSKIGGQDTITGRYKLSIPITSPKLQSRDRVRITHCDRTPHLVEEVFYVEDQILTTFAVAQSVLIAREFKLQPLDAG